MLALRAPEEKRERKEKELVFNFKKVLRARIKFAPNLVEELFLNFKKLYERETSSRLIWQKNCF